VGERGLGSQALFACLSAERVAGQRGLQAALVDRRCCHVEPPSDSVTLRRLPGARCAPVNRPSNLDLCSEFACSGR